MTPGMREDRIHFKGIGEPLQDIGRSGVSWLQEQYV